MQTPPNKFAPFELGNLLIGHAGATIESVLVGDILRVTYEFPRVGIFRSSLLGQQNIELSADSGEIAYFEAVMHEGLSIGLVSHRGIARAEDYYSSRWLGYASGGLGWNANGYINSFLDGVRCACRVPDLKANAGDRMGMMVDCSSEPTLRFFVNGSQVHYLCVGEDGYQDRVFPAFHLHNAEIEIISNPELPHI